MVRKSTDAEFERVPMVRGESGAYEGMLFDVSAPMDYYVEAEGVRSGTFSLKVVEMPYVQQLELEYHFPAVHRPAAAEDRGRRRHRRPARHGGARPRGADDGHARRSGGDREGRAPRP